MEESHVIITIILIFVVLGVLLVMIIPTASGAQDSNNAQIDFRQACVHWSLAGYFYPIDDANPLKISTSSGTKIINMEGLCKKETGTLIGEVDWVKCQNACKLTSGGTQEAG